MIKIHHGKIPDWYNTDAKYEEANNEDTHNSRTTNQTIEKYLKKQSQD